MALTVYCWDHDDSKIAFLNISKVENFADPAAVQTLKRDTLLYCLSPQIKWTLLMMCRDV